MSDHFDRIQMWLATGVGAGYVPKAPGTAGSLVSVGLFALARWQFPDPTFLYGHLVALILLFFVGVWAGTGAERILGRRDPQQVVIDEIVGQQICYFALPVLEWKSLLAGFILFRGFDIVKPFPIRRLERAPGGWGLMLDDVLAGIYAWAVLRLFRMIVG